MNNLTPSLIKDIQPGAASSGIKDLTSFNGNLAFIANNGEVTTIFQSDGTTTGTVPLSAINVLFEDFPEGGIDRLITAVGNKLFFVAGVGGNRFSRVFIASTDGTANATSEVFFLSGNDNATGTPNDVTFLDNFNKLNENLAFATRTIEFIGFSMTVNITTRLAISDGTQQDTSVIQTFNSRESADLIGEIVNVNGNIFFSAGATTNNIVGASGILNQLWKSDGTEAGTNLVATVGENSFSIQNLTDINGTLFFTGETEVLIDNPQTNTSDFIQTGIELFKSDGTSEGTVLIKDINPGEISSNLSDLTNVNGTVFFAADDGTNGTELWKSDGTESGTVLVKDIIPGLSGSLPKNLTNVNGTLFFTATDGVNGVELWKSDGTAEGTILVKDINPGSNFSNPDNLTDFEGLLYFAADDGSNGTELWKSDGTADGTVLVGDINPGGASSNPQDLTVVNGELYFSADDGVNGRELWGLTETNINNGLILGERIKRCSFR